VETARQVIWSPQAVADLRQLHGYIGKRNPDAANRLLKNIIAAVNRVSEMPGMGRPGRVPGSSEWVVAPYIIVYGVSSEFLEVSRVIHGARQWLPPKG
jgi:addiction module RelE/StbE family toxin